MHTINPEQVENHSKCNNRMRLLSRSRICRFHFETDEVLGTDFVRCDMNDVKMCIEKTLLTTLSVFREG